ncbi:MAG: AAA family ATPase [Bacteroidota bacterium]
MTDHLNTPTALALNVAQEVIPSTPVEGQPLPVQTESQDQPETESAVQTDESPEAIHPEVAPANPAQEDIVTGNPDPELLQSKPDPDLVIKTEQPFIFSAEELLQDKIERIPMLWDPFFPKVGLVAIVGSSDTGKSTFLRDFAMNVVLKKEAFLDFPLKPNFGSVLYISTEDDRYAITSLIKKQKSTGSHATSYAKLRFMFETENLIPRIKDAILEQPVDCIIVDSFADVMDGDLNRSTDVRRYLDPFSRIAVREELLFIFLHHTSKKSDQNNPSKQFILGSQGFEAKMRMVAELRKDSEYDDLRHFCVLKGNYIPSEYKGRSYVLGINENLTFLNMDDRVGFDRLSNKPGAQNWDTISKRAKALKEEGKSVRAISEVLKQEGLTVGKTKVSEILNQDNAA